MRPEKEETLMYKRGRWGTGTKSPVGEKILKILPDHAWNKKNDRTRRRKWWLPDGQPTLTRKLGGTMKNPTVCRVRRSGGTCRLEKVKRASSLNGKHREQKSGQPSPFNEVSEGFR